MQVLVDLFKNYEYFTKHKIKICIKIVFIFFCIYIPNWDIVGYSLKTKKRYKMAIVGTVQPTTKCGSRNSLVFIVIEIPLQL